MEGNWREEHLFSLAQAVALYDVYHQKITECDRQIEAYLQTFADRSDGQPLPPPSRPRKRGRNQPAFAVREPLHRITGVDLSQIEGLDETTSLVILSEIGLDMTSLADRETLHVVVGSLSASTRLRRQGPQPADQVLCQPGGHRAATWQPRPCTTARVP